MSNGYIPAVLPPGNHKAKILKIELRERPFKTKTGATITDIVLHLETEPIGGNFKGLKKDYTDDSKGVFLGQVAKVRSNEWGFSDGQNRSGDPIDAQKEMLKALKSLCMEIGQLKWFQDQDEKLPTASQLVEAINKAELFKDHYLYWCLASRQYMNKKNYATDDLYLPRYSKEDGKPFSKKMDDLIVYNSAKHLVKPAGAANTSNSTAQTTPPNQTSILDNQNDDNLGDPDWLNGD